MVKAIDLETLFAAAELPFGHPGYSDFGDRHEPRAVDPPEKDIVHYSPGDRPLCGHESPSAIYTDEPGQVAGCEDCLELLAEDLQDQNGYRDTAFTAGRKSPPRVESNGAGSSGDPALTAHAQVGTWYDGEELAAATLATSFSYPFFALVRATSLN